MWLLRFAGFLFAILFLFSCSKESDTEGNPPSSSSTRGSILFPPGFPTATLRGALVDLRWQDSNEDEEGYLVERRVPNVSGFAPIAFLPPGTTTYTDRKTLENYTYFYRIVAVRKGVTAPSSEIRVTIPDLTPPDTEILLGPPSRTRLSSAFFYFSSNEPVTGFVCTVDGNFLPCSVSSYFCDNPERTCGSGFVSGLLSGTHRFTVKAWDRSGKGDPTPAIWEWTIFNDPPVITIQNRPPSVTKDTSGTIAFSADRPSIFFCRFSFGGNKGRFLSCSSPLVFDVEDGTRDPSVTIKAIDYLGNESVVTVSWVIDYDPPLVNLQGCPPSRIKPSDPVTVSFTLMDDTTPPWGISSYCTTRKGDGSIVSGPELCADPPTSPVNYTVLYSPQETLYTTSVTGVDLFGRVSSPGSCSWIVDNTPPSITFTSTPAGVTEGSFLRYFIGTTEPVILYCKFSTDPGYTVCTNPYDRERVPPGSYTLEVTAVDQVGLVSIPITHTVTVTYPPFGTDPGGVSGAFLKILEGGKIYFLSGGVSVPTDILWDPHYPDDGCNLDSSGNTTFPLAVSLPNLNGGGVVGVREGVDLCDQGFTGGHLSGGGVGSPIWVTDPDPAGSRSLTAGFSFPSCPPPEKITYFLLSYDSLQYRNPSGCNAGTPSVTYPAGDQVGIARRGGNHILIRSMHPPPENFPRAGTSYLFQFLLDGRYSSPPTGVLLEMADPQGNPLSTLSLPWSSLRFSSLPHGNALVEGYFSFPSCIPYGVVRVKAFGGSCPLSSPLPSYCEDRIQIPVDSTGFSCP